MSQGLSATMHPEVFGSAREETEDACARHAGDTAEQPSADVRLQDDAIYFSRRAREELRAAIEANEGKARKSHLDLAQAYDCRAHLITGKILKRSGVDMQPDTAALSTF